MGHLREDMSSIYNRRCTAVIDCILRPSRFLVMYMAATVNVPFRIRSAGSFIY